MNGIHFYTRRLTVAPHYTSVSLLSLCDRRVGKTGLHCAVSIWQRLVDLHQPGQNGVVRFLVCQRAVITAAEIVDALQSPA